MRLRRADHARPVVPRRRRRRAVSRRRRSASATCCGSASCSLALPLVSAVVRRPHPLPAVLHARGLEPARVAGRPGRRAVALRLDNVSRLPDRAAARSRTRCRTSLGVAAAVRARPGRAARPPRGDLHRALATCAAATARPAADPADRPVRHVRADPLVHRARHRSSSRPVVAPLPRSRWPASGPGSGDSRAAVGGRAGEDDVGTREYRHGDDLRRVHWRSTARYGELMVRREEQPWQSRAHAAARHPRRPRTAATGRRRRFEWAVSAAASIGVHLAPRGYTVRLLTDTGGQHRRRRRRPDSGTDVEGACSTRSRSCAEPRRDAPARTPRRRCAAAAATGCSSPCSAR